MSTSRSAQMLCRVAARASRSISAFPRLAAAPRLTHLYSTGTSSGPAVVGGQHEFPSPLSGTSSSPPKDKMVHIKNISAESEDHHEFRTVVWTGRSSQLVLMSVPSQGDIGEEVHHVDQHLFFTAGKGRAIVGGEEKDVEAGDLVIVPQGVKHNFVNTGPTPLNLYTVYAPAEHDPRSLHLTKDEGERLEDEGKDEAPKWSQ